jgi:tape measure domain-containing protein
VSDAGVIEYTVSVETQASIDAANKVNESLNKTEKAMKDTESASGKLGGGMKKMATSVKRANVEIAESNKRFSALGKVIGSVIAFMGGKAVIDMADQYMEMSSRLKGATADTEEYEKVQARLLQTANNTYRPLQEAAEVYIRTSKAIKDLGYNTDQVLDITDSFSYLLVTNSASAERGASAINSYSKAIQTGRVDSMTWQSILAAMPSVVEDIATATGSTEAAIRKLGIEGKLSLGALNEALLRSKDKNLELADAMDTTVGDAMVAFRNSMTVFIGKVNESSGASAGLVTAVEDMSAILQDPATIKAAQDLAVGVVNAFSSIISAVKTTVEVVKWGAESMAAFMNGAALDDVVRLQDEIERYNKMLANPLTRLEFGGGNRKGGWLSEADINENIGTRKKHIEDYYKSQAEMYAAEQKKLKDILDNPASAPDVSAPVAAEAANDKVSKSLGRRTAARKQLTEEEKRAAQFAKKLADAEKQNIDVMDKLAESIYQTFLNAD